MDRHRPFRRQSASVLILVLWVLAILSLLGLSLASSSSLESQLTSYQRDLLAARALAKAGYTQALAELEKDLTPALDYPLDSWAYNPKVFQDCPLGKGSFSVSYVRIHGEGEEEVVYGIQDEDRKININTASQPVLARLPGFDQELAEEVEDWRADHAGLGEEAGLFEIPPFRETEELLRVEGMDEELYAQAAPSITAYTDGTVNLNTAAAEVLRALGMGETLADKIAGFRRGLDAQEGTADDQPFPSVGDAEQLLNKVSPLTPPETSELRTVIAQNLLKVFAQVFRISSKGAVREGKIRVWIEAVVRRDKKEGKTVFTVLAWHES